MPTSATGATEARRRVHARVAGFTLIEIMVVMVIFAIAAGLVTLRMLPDDRERARREADSAAVLLERAADEAERTGRVIAWHPDGASARFEVPDQDGKWIPLADDPDFGERTLAGELAWSALHFVQPPDTGAGAADAGSDAAASGTRLVFLPGQTVPLFDIRLGKADAQVLLRGDALGRVSVESLP